MFCLSPRALPAHRATSARTLWVPHDLQAADAVCGHTKVPEVALQQAADGLSAQGALREHSSAAPRASIPPSVFGRG